MYFSTQTYPERAGFLITIWWRATMIVHCCPSFSLIGFNLSGLCNRTCVFCPRVNPKIYPNINKHIPVELYERIVKELAEVEYDGMILFSAFSEPLLYKRIEVVKELSKTLLSQGSYRSRYRR